MFCQQKKKRKTIAIKLVKYGNVVSPCRKEKFENCGNFGVIIIFSSVFVLEAVNDYSVHKKRYIQFYFLVSFVI